MERLVQTRLQVQVALEQLRPPLELAALARPPRLLAPVVSAAMALEPPKLVDFRALRQLLVVLAAVALVAH